MAQRGVVTHAGRRFGGQAGLDQALVGGLLLRAVPVAGGEFVVVENDRPVHAESLQENSGHHAGAVLASVAVEHGG